MARYEMKYRRPRSSSPSSVNYTVISANSSDEAKAKIRRNNGDDVIFVSVIIYGSNRK